MKYLILYLAVVFLILAFNHGAHMNDNDDE